jgi:hypothetical protein
LEEVAAPLGSSPADRVEWGLLLQALSSYDLLLRQSSDFAFTEYARIERALVLYQLGR